MHLLNEQNLQELELQKQDLFGQQKGHSQKMHQIDMAAEAHRRALEKELGPEQVRICCCCWSCYVAGCRRGTVSCIPFSFSDFNF